MNAKTLAIAVVATLALGIASTAKADDIRCSNAILKGTYAYTSNGFITAPPEIAGPVAEVGTQTFDGNGRTTAVATLSSNGTIYQLTITGTYTVNPDCTGTFTLQISPFDLTLPVYFVLANGGTEFQAIENGAGFVITRLGHSQFPAGK